MELENQITLDINRTMPSDYILQRKLESATEGLSPEYKNKLTRINKKNSFTILKYIESMKIEINFSDNYRRTIIKLLAQVSRYFNDKKTFNNMGRNDILSFLDSTRKNEESDPLHRWISTYNIYGIHLSLVEAM